MSHFLHAASPDARQASLVTPDVSPRARGLRFKLSDKGYWLCSAGLLNKLRKRTGDRAPVMAEIGELVDIW